jgi:RNA polymerase sigma factor (sigma-70 family)
MMMELTDAELWSRAADDDSDAFAGLFERHARTIYNYCFRLTADWALAEDLTSVVFLEAWRRRRLQVPGALILAWLLGIAANLVRNQRRSLRRYRSALARVPPPSRDPDFADDVAERVDGERQMTSMLRLLRQLPRRQQDVLLLCDWTGLTYQEASVALRIPVGTVRSRLSRARRSLRESVAFTGNSQDARSSSVGTKLVRPWKEWEF